MNFVERIRNLTQVGENVRALFDYLIRLFLKATFTDLAAIDEYTKSLTGAEIAAWNKKHPNASITEFSKYAQRRLDQQEKNWQRSRKLYVQKCHN